MNNEFEKGGLWIRGTESDHFLSNIFESNTVETKPISILTNRFSEIIDASSYGQLFLFNSSDCVVENAIIDYRSVGVSLALCNDCIVQNLNSTYSQICLVELQLCFNTEVTRCNIAESYNAGFRFLSTHDCSLTECKAGYSPGNTAFGIECYNTENTTIARNIFQANGVLCRDSVDFLIMHNNVEGSTAVQGIGVHASNSHNYTINDNELFELYIGLFFEIGDSNTTISNNRIHDNHRYGIELGEACEGFRIYNNSFWYNDLGHAIDKGNSNNWDDGISIGNQWDDYSGTGVYNIPGSAGSVDHFPRADPYHTRTTTIITTTTSTTTGGTTTNDSILPLILGIGGVGAVLVVIIIFTKKR
jgi:parallel beta-helix repeat protein